MKPRVIYIAIALLIALQLLCVITLIKENNNKLNSIEKIVSDVYIYCLE